MNRFNRLFTIDFGQRCFEVYFGYKRIMFRNGAGEFLESECLVKCKLKERESIR